MKCKKLIIALGLMSSIAFAEPMMMKNSDLETTVISAYSFKETVKKLEKTFESKGLKIFEEIDHQKAAKKVGLEMQPAVVLIYGNPKVGTQYMVKDPKFALQLPLKVLITEVDGEVMVVFNTTKFLSNASDIIKNQDLVDTLGKVEKLIPATIAK